MNSEKLIYNFATKDNSLIKMNFNPTIAFIQFIN